MKHWAVLVVLLYGVLLAVLTGPALYLAFVELPPKAPSVDDILKIYSAWQYWLIVIAIPMSAQALFLVVPVRLAQGRPVRRRSVWATALATGFAIGLLVLGLLSCIYELAFAGKSAPDSCTWLVLCAGVGSWGFWTFLFAREARIEPPDDWMARICRWLYIGSIAEFLVAVPTHIIARRRGYCCAGFGTFFGIACGLAVLLLAFGPAVLALFAKRWRRLHAARAGDRVRSVQALNDQHE